jgi:hypothetical protein
MTVILWNSEFHHIFKQLDYVPLASKGGMIELEGIWNEFHCGLIEVHPTNSALRMCCQT